MLYDDVTNCFHPINPWSVRSKLLNEAMRTDTYIYESTLWLFINNDYVEETDPEPLKEHKDPIINDAMKKFMEDNDIIRLLKIVRNWKIDKLLETLKTGDSVTGGSLHFMNYETEREEFKRKQKIERSKYRKYLRECCGEELSESSSSYSSFSYSDLS